MTTATLCPSCGETVAEEDDFCESCGTRLHAPPPQEGICPKCGAPAEAADADGYCTRCGYRMPRPSDHIEVEQGGMALVSDKGLRHHRNEDAGAIRAPEGFSVLVVCDGVSTTANPDQASAAAAAATAEVAVAALSGDEPGAEEAAAALVDALGAAQEAVRNAPPEEQGGYIQAPSTTLAAVVVIGDQVVAANVGDSRAYWIDATSPEACRLLSHDDSLAEAAIAAGASPEEAYARRDAHTITHWLGTDAPELAPHIETITVPGPGMVIVCSDGLWNYYETPASLRQLIASGPPGEGVLDTARRLVDAALEAGGHDNITVAVKPLGTPSWVAEGEAAGVTEAAGATEVELVEAVPSEMGGTEVEATAGAAPVAEAPPAAEAAAAPEPVSETPGRTAPEIESPPASESHESEE